MQRIASGGVPP